MKRLWKHIDHMNLRNVVAGRSQQLCVPRKGHRITGDVDDLRGRNPRQKRTNLRTHACSGRIHYDEIRTLSLYDCVSQKLYGRCFRGTLARSLEGPGQIARGGFNRDDLLKGYRHDLSMVSRLEQALGETAGSTLRG